MFLVYRGACRGTKSWTEWKGEKVFCVFNIVHFQYLLSMLCTKDFPSVNYSLLTQDIVLADILWCPNDFFQQVCHQKQLNWFVCLFVFPTAFAEFSLEKRDRHRATEQWVSNSSLSARLAYRASLIYFHFTTLKTVGSGYSNIFINLPR